MKINNSNLNNFEKIPTLYDDIIKEIKMEKIKKYYQQKPPETKQGTYVLGDVLGNILDKII